MLAYRRTWYVKLGRMQEALELIQQAVDTFRDRGFTGRAYSSNVGPADVIVWEEDWSSTQEHDQAWAEFGNTAEAKEWFQQWFKLVERGGMQETWNLKA